MQHFEHAARTYKAEEESRVSQLVVVDTLMLSGVLQVFQHRPYTVHRICLAEYALFTYYMCQQQL